MENKENNKQESKLLVKDRDVVVPGQVLAEGFDFLPSYGTYRDNENIFTSGAEGASLLRLHKTTTPKLIKHHQTIVAGLKLNCEPNATPNKKAIETT